MKLVEIIAELQSNPRNMAAYRKLVDQCRLENRVHEAETFLKLIEKINGSSDSNKGQSSNDPQNA